MVVTELEWEDVWEAERWNMEGIGMGGERVLSEMATCVCTAVKVLSHKPSYLILTIVS